VRVTFDPDYNQAYPPIRQTVDWTCSACSWAWLANSIGAHETEWTAVERIGIPENINEMYGLTDASGQALDDAYSRVYSWPSHHSGSVTWQDAIALAWAGPLLLGGRAWCHWTAVTGTDGNGLYLANPAPTWFGVGDWLDQFEWDRLGSWSAVWLAA
jgi:hypothetical protein